MSPRVKKKLKIAMIAPIAERVPPKKYGGTERVVSALTEELVKRGHKLTLFASGDSITNARLASVYPRGLREARVPNPHGLNEWALLHIGAAYARRHEFDIVHDHNSIIALPTASLSDMPVVLTVHGNINPNNRKLYESIKGPYLIGISQSQFAKSPNVEVFDVVYNGLDMYAYPFKKKHKNYLLYVGRISMEKGTHYAIDVAQTLDLPLIIAAKLDTADKAYYHEYVEHRLSDEKIRWIGEVDEMERNTLMSEAMCLLHPVTWREPFGLTMIESMACGTPVVAFDKGSIPEIVKDRSSGFVVGDIDEMIEAVSQIESIDRKKCRAYALSHFNSGLMAERYEDIYFRILKENVRKE